MCILYYYYNGLILPLYPVQCRFKRDFYSLSRGSRDISVLLSLFQFLFIYLFFYLFIYFFVSFPSSFLLLSSLTTVVAVIRIKWNKFSTITRYIQKKSLYCIITVHTHCKFIGIYCNTNSRNGIIYRDLEFKQIWKKTGARRQRAKYDWETNPQSVPFPTKCLGIPGYMI